MNLRVTFNALARNGQWPKRMAASFIQGCFYEIGDYGDKYDCGPNQEQILDGCLPLAFPHYHDSLTFSPFITLFLSCILA